MKREILFRGKRVFDNKFEYGFLSWHSLGDGVNYFVNNNVVYPETVGQFTGMTDKNGTKIFEGDIVNHTRRTSNGIESTNAEVYFDTEMLEFGLKELNELFHVQFNDEFEVIGNIQDNPELLK